MEDGPHGKIVLNAAIVVEEVANNKAGVVLILYLSVEVLNVWDPIVEQYHVMNNVVQVNIECLL